MRRQDLIALGLSSLVAGTVATSARQPAPGRPIPPSAALPAVITRAGAEVRQQPAANAPVIGRLSRGDRVMVDPTETSFPGFTAIVHESLTDTDVPGTYARIMRNLGWLATSDVTVEAAPVPVTAAPRGQTVVIGTIGGHHSLAETRDLLAVADYRFDEVEAALRENRLKPTNAAASAAVEADWSRLAATWADARKDIARNLSLKRLAVPFIYGADYVPTEDEWVRTLSFVEGQELVRGSLQDITLRLERLLGRKILFEGQPGQNAPDVDIELFQDLDAGIKEGEAMASRAKEAAKRAVTSPTGLAIGSTLLAAGGLLLAVTFLPEIRLGLSALRGRR